VPCCAVLCPAGCQQHHKVQGGRGAAADREARGEQHAPPTAPISNPALSPFRTPISVCTLTLACLTPTHAPPSLPSRGAGLLRGEWSAARGGGSGLSRFSSHWPEGRQVRCRGRFARPCRPRSQGHLCAAPLATIHAWRAGRFAASCRRRCHAPPPPLLGESRRSPPLLAAHPPPPRHTHTPATAASTAAAG